MLNRIKQTIRWEKLKIALYVIAVLTVVVVIQLAINHTFINETKLIKAFEGTKATPVRGKLQVVGNFGDKYLTTEDKEKLIDYVSSQLGITDTLDKKVVKGNTTVSVTAKVVGKASTTDIEAISITSESKEKIKQTTQYLYITIDIYDQMSSVLGYKDIVEDMLDNAGLERVDSSILLTGVYQGKLSLLDKNSITDQILDTLEAEVAAENRTEGIYTVYAYTPNISHYIEAEGSRVNLNIAFSYDEDKEETNIYLASPVINEDY